MGPGGGESLLGSESRCFTRDENNVTGRAPGRENTGEDMLTPRAGKAEVISQKATEKTQRGEQGLQQQKGHHFHTHTHTHAENADGEALQINR